MEWIWLGLMIALVVIELTTTQLICVWFAFGAMVTSILGWGAQAGRPRASAATDPGGTC